MLRMSPDCRKGLLSRCKVRCVRFVVDGQREAVISAGDERFP